MKKSLAVLVALGLVAGAVASPALARKKKPKKPVPVDVTYYLVWNGEGCAIATTQANASPEDACADVFSGALGPELGTGPFLMPALDGIPLTLDAAKAIKGTINVESWYATGEVPDVMGVGAPQLEVALTGTSAGEEIVIGQFTSEPYIVTPASAEYVVEFEITPAPELAGKVFDSLTLSLESTGNAMFHGVFPADGTSTIVLGAFSKA